VVAGDLRSLNLKPLDLDDRPGAAVSGEPVVLLGYPTALDAILARAGGDTPPLAREFCERWPVD